jgi:hypothetical protein
MYCKVLNKGQQGGSALRAFQGESTGQQADPCPPAPPLPLPPPPACTLLTPSPPLPPPICAPLLT